MRGWVVARSYRGDVAAGWKQLAATIVSNPVEVLDRLEGRRQRRRQTVGHVPVDREQPLAAVHELLGVDECAVCAEAVERVWDNVSDRLGSGHHHDGGPALAGALWAAVHHLAPQTVVETGVARGVTSAFILDAMARGDRGHLWSIDLPPMSSDWGDQTGQAVDPAHRYRWTYIRGAARRELPKLLDHLGALDVFVHDGLHTAENMGFELRLAWPSIEPGGLLVSDDIDDNPAWESFAGAAALAVAEPGKRGVIGLQRKSPIDAPTA